jgi:hypothetical protein
VRHKNVQSTAGLHPKLSGILEPNDKVIKTLWFASCFSSAAAYSKEGDEESGTLKEEWGRLVSWKEALNDEVWRDI